MKTKLKEILLFLVRMHRYNYNQRVIESIDIRVFSFVSSYVRRGLMDMELSRFRKL